VLGRAQGDAAALGLQPDQAAGARRDPDRAGAIRPGGRGAQAGRHGGRAAAARAARRAIGVPRVARDAERGPLGGAHDGQLGQVGLAEDDRAGGAQPGDEVVVALDRAAVGGRAPGRELAGHVLGVLDGDRHAQQRPVVPGRAPGVRLLGVGQRALGHHRPVRAQLAVVAANPVEVEEHELPGGDLAAAHEVGLVRGAREGELVAVHS
jgi:hypothetical protein